MPNKLAAAFVLAAILSLCCARSGLAADAGPASSTGAAAATSASPTKAGLGWCQCIADITRIHASCQSSVADCKAACGGGNIYSYIPDAEESCAKAVPASNPGSPPAPAPAPASPPHH